MNKKEELLMDILKNIRMLLSCISSEIPSLKGNSNASDAMNELCKEIEELEDEYYYN